MSVYDSKAPTCDPLVGIVMICELYENPSKNELDWDYIGYSQFPTNFFLTPVYTEIVLPVNLWKNRTKKV